MANNSTVRAGIFDTLWAFYRWLRGVFSTKEEVSTVAASVAARQPVIPVTSHGTADTTFTLAWDSKHTWGTVSSLQLTVPAPPADGKAHEIIIVFTSDSSGTTLSLSDNVKWQSSGDPDLSAGKRVEINIAEDLTALYAEFDV